MELIYYVSFVAQFLTYASFLSGARVCQQIYRQKSCSKLSPLPFLAGLNCTALWLRYGFIAKEWEIVAVNLAGLICQSVYLVFFVYYSNQQQKQRLLKQLLSSIALLLFLLWAINHAADPLFLGGSLASLSSLVACASPLATIQDVLKTRCVASLPFPIIISSFVVSLSWLTFGVLKGDNFIVFSNIVAVSISGAQLTLFLVYPSTMPYEKLSPSNRKSYDLIRLLEDDVDDELEPLEGDAVSDEIDTSLDYKETLGKIMGQIYSKRERMSNSTKKNPSSSVILLYAAT